MNFVDDGGGHGMGDWKAVSLSQAKKSAEKKVWAIEGCASSKKG